jgi:alkanesulfonate monooxygenase SsuD/methylene tetrahydromethanopterin reductase-like flavin-dependent oxidoreductase (luciferase family)
MNPNKLAQTNISVLDLAIVRDGGNASDTFKKQLEPCSKVENWGYKRFWLAEHHIQGIASSATVILIGHIAN